MTSEKKTVSKKISEKNEFQTCRVDVPHGGQILHHFVLTPQLPENGKARDWPLTDPETGKEISLVEVGFCEDSTPTQSAFERAIFVIDLADEGIAKEGIWYFVNHGAIPCHGSEDVLHAIDTEIVNGGKTLIVYVQLDQLGKETVNFSYLAAYIENTSGEARVYRSEDPGIVVGRPVRP